MDTRSGTEDYYDIGTEKPDDIPFYKELIGSTAPSVLELGCGTGRVTAQLAEVCSYIHGLDQSESMLTNAWSRLEEQRLPAGRAYVELGDIASFDLGREFDLIIAPFRVFQNIEQDQTVAGVFECIRKHLAADGTCILNVFNPNAPAEKLRAAWQKDVEDFTWEVLIVGGRVTCHTRRLRIDTDNLIVYPEFIYRRYADDDLIDEARHTVAMRCYYPAQFEELIVNYGFKIHNRWGGYHGEVYGEGPELIIEFS